MVKRVYLLLLLLLFLPLGYSLDCQYQKEIDKVYFEIKNDQAVLTNTNDDTALNFQIEASYLSPEGVFCGEVERSVDTRMSLSPGELTSISLPEGSSNPFCSSPEWTGEYSTEYKETSDVAIIREGSTRILKTCDGKGDGAPCDTNNDCGGGYCVEGRCNDEPRCYRNDCECGPDEIQCGNSSCVAKNRYWPGESPKCGLAEECRSGLIENGVCQKTPEQIEQERNQLIIYTSLSVFGTLLLVFSIIYFWPNIKKKYRDIQIKRKLNKQKQLSQEIKEVEKKKEDLTEEMKEEKKKLSEEIQSEKQKKEALNEELEEEKEKLERLKQEANKNLSEQFFKKAKDRFGDDVYLDDKQYIRFESSDQPVHRWVYKNEYDETIEDDEEIHHIDANRTNYQPYNLIKLTREQHKKVNHGKITQGMWEEGIEELLRIGISSKDFPKAVKEKYDKEFLD